MTDQTTRDRILQIASGLFMESGYASTSTRMIAKAAEITQPNLYYHFPNKENLYVEACRYLSVSIYQHLREIVLEDDRLDPEEYSERLIAFRGKLLAMSRYLAEDLNIDLQLMAHNLRMHLSEEVAEELRDIWEEAYLKPFIELFDEYKAIMTKEIPQERLMIFFLTFLTAFMNLGKIQSQSLTLEESLNIFIRSCIDPVYLLG